MFQNSPLRPSPPNHSPGTPGPPLMGPGPGFPPMGPRYGGGRGAPGMMRPIMGPGGEPFNGHPGDGDFFPMQGDILHSTGGILTLPICRSPRHGS